MTHRNAQSHSNAPIFEDKTGRRYQGKITKIGSAKFEAARKRLAELVGDRTASQTSDSDTIEFLARGEQETREYLARK